MWYILFCTHLTSLDYQHFVNGPRGFWKCWPIWLFCENTDRIPNLLKSPIMFEILYILWLYYTGAVNGEKAVHLENTMAVSVTVLCCSVFKGPRTP